MSAGASRLGRRSSLMIGLVSQILVRVPNIAVICSPHAASFPERNRWEDNDRLGRSDLSTGLQKVFLVDRPGTNLKGLDAARLSGEITCTLKSH
jgi:hypothetical protein